MKRPPFLALSVVLAISCLCACGSLSKTAATATASAAGIAHTASTTPAPTAAAPILAATPDAASGLGTFTCTLPVMRPGTGQPLPGGVVRPTTARVGGQSGNDRIIFEYAGTALPSLTLTSVAPPFALDPSGLPLTVSGQVFLGIVLRNLSFPSGYSGPSSFNARLPVLTDLKLRGDFEGVQQWVAGLTGRACVRVFTLTGPTRLVIDLVSSPVIGAPNTGGGPGFDVGRPR